MPKYFPPSFDIFLPMFLKLRYKLMNGPLKRSHIWRSDAFDAAALEVLHDRPCTVEGRGGGNGESSERDLERVGQSLKNLPSFFFFVVCV